MKKRPRSILDRILQVIGIAFVSIFLLPRIALYLYSGWPVLRDQITNKVLLLDNRVTVFSPDHKRVLIGDVNGEVQIEEVAEKKIVASATIDVRRYRNLTVKWTEPNRIEVVADYRYPLQMNRDGMVWDSQLQEIKKP